MSRGIRFWSRVCCRTLVSLFSAELWLSMVMWGKNDTKCYAKCNIILGVNRLFLHFQENSRSHDACVQWQGQTLQMIGARAGLCQLKVWHDPDGGHVRLLDGGRAVSRQPYSPPAKVRPMIKNNQRHKPSPASQIRLPGTPARRESNPSSALGKTG